MTISVLNGPTARSIEKGSGKRKNEKYVQASRRWCGGWKDG